MQGYIAFNYEEFAGSDSKMHARMYGKVTPKERVKNYRPYCDLKEAIASFYKLELDYSMRKREFWMGRHEDYYVRQVVEKSLTVLRFTIAAAVGEARHFRTQARTYSGLPYDIQRKTRGYVKEHNKAKQYIALLMGGVGFHNSPASRVIVYRSYVDEANWLRYLTASWHIYNNVRWSGSFGGKKWAKGCEHAIRLYRALCGGSFSEIAIRFDTLINHFHNGGLLLNKFDCGPTLSLEGLLNRKQKGDFERIDIMLNTIPCDIWKCGGCDHLLRCKPTNKRGGFNGKGKKQEEKEVSQQAWWVATDISAPNAETNEVEEDGCGDPSCSQCYPQG